MPFRRCGKGASTSAKAIFPLDGKLCLAAEPASRKKVFTEKKKSLQLEIPTITM